MKEVEKAYIAGMIDGEGSFGLHKIIDKRTNDYSIRTSISIANNDLKIILWIKRKLNGTYIKQDKRRSKSVYSLRICAAKDILKVLNTVEQYLKIKKKHAAIMRKYIESRLDQWERYERKQSRPSPSYSKMEIRLADQLKILNKRGMN